MGYSTGYSLEVLESDKSFEEIYNEVVYDYEDIEWAMDENGQRNEPCKWYDHEEHMKEISKLYPGVIFKLHGEGEESGDVWYKYFKDGKMQDCPARLTFDEYDENKLK